MENLFADIVRLQLASAQGWLQMSNQMLHGWQQMTKANMDLFHPPFFLHRWHNALPEGADWFDGYGKRAHDVDVEHMR